MADKDPYENLGIQRSHRLVDAQLAARSLHHLHIFEMLVAGYIAIIWFDVSLSLMQRCCLLLAVAVYPPADR
jgi:hypothetical protein